MHGFEQLTLAPLDRKLIDTALLTPDERAYVDAYHAEVWAKVGPLMDGEAKAWLETACAPLK
jgi:Xaa-Pro aminopeptidase